LPIWPDRFTLLPFVFGRSAETRVPAALSAVCFGVIEVWVYLPLAVSRLRKVGQMKKNIHPEYRPVVFMDTSTGTRFLINSTIRSKEMTKWEDGQEYPLFKIEISAASHPFYTGKMKFVDSAGRVEKFTKKYKWGKKEDAAQ
jgi:large subunit ribosomal protein L31